MALPTQPVCDCGQRKMTNDTANMRLLTTFKSGIQSLPTLTHSAYSTCGMKWRSNTSNVNQFLHSRKTDFKIKQMASPSDRTTQYSDLLIFRLFTCCSVSAFLLSAEPQLAIKERQEKRRLVQT